MTRATRLALIALAPAIALHASAMAQSSITNSTGSVGCAALAQSAANGMTARIQANDAVPAPTSVTNMTCLGNFFNGVGLNLVTSLLNPATLLQSVEGQICGAVQRTWSSELGSAQCGLTISGFNLGFGGIGGGLSCPSLSFGGGGPPIATVGVGAGSNGGGLYINGAGLPPTGYAVPGLTPGTF